MYERIMVITDDEAMRERIVTFLSAHLYLVTSQGHADYTQAKAIRARPYLFILDQEAEDADSVWQTLQKLWLDRQLASLPTIICNSAAIEDKQVAAYAIKQITFVAKPFADEQLLIAIRSALESAQLLRYQRQHSNGKHENLQCGLDVERKLGNSW